MGLILRAFRHAEDLLDTIGQLFGPISRRLAYAVIFVGALLAATTGWCGERDLDGLISLPIFSPLRVRPADRLRHVAASGTLAQIIPPSGSC